MAWELHTLFRCYREMIVQYLSRLFCFFVLFLLFPVYAVTIPSDILGTREYNRVQCNAELSQNCIIEGCSRSTARDCLEQCRGLAQDKCSYLGYD